MPIANYSTTVEAAKTIAEIQAILLKHGARRIITDYDGTGQVAALAFSVETPHGEVGFRLPVNPEAVLRVLSRQAGVPRHFQQHPQAVRVAWRIVREWVRAQMALLETEQVRMEQIFLPYLVTPDDRTLYEVMADKKFALPVGSTAP